jgi:integral membrane sensor domain MASE1
MHSNPSNRGRWLVAAAAVILIVACLMQWWQIGGEAGHLSQRNDVGLSDGRGFLIFLLSITTLLLLTLPYATDRPVAIDHPVVYLVLLLVMFGAFIWRTVGLILEQDVNLLPFPPQRGPGYWLAALGLAVFARGVFELFDQRRRM